MTGLAEPCEASGGGVEGDEGITEGEELGFVETAEERGGGFGDAWEFPEHEVEGELAGAFESALFEAFDAALDTTGVDEGIDEFRHGLRTGEAGTSGG